MVLESKLIIFRQIGKKKVW